MNFSDTMAACPPAYGKPRDKALEKEPFLQKAGTLTQHLLARQQPKSAGRELSDTLLRKLEPTPRRNHNRHPDHDDDCGCWCFFMRFLLWGMRYSGK